MAATPTLLTADTSTSNPGITASVAPAAGRLLELDVISVTTSGAGTVAANFSVAGLGATWVLVDFQLYGARRGIWRFRAESDGTAGALTLSYSGPGTFAEMCWALKQWSGQVVGNNGADAVGAPVKAATFDTVLTLPSVGTPAAGDAVSAVFGIEAAGGGGTLEAGYTTLADQAGTDANIRQMLAGWRDAAGDTTPSANWGTASSAGGVGNLIIAAAGGTVPEVAATVPLGLAVGAQVQADHQAAATVPLGLAVGAETQAEHQAAATVPLGLAVGAEAATEHRAAAEVPLSLAVGAVAEAPGVSNVTATIALGLAVGAEAATERAVAAEVPLGLVVGAATGDPEPGRPIEPFPDGRPVAAFPAGRLVAPFPPGRAVAPSPVVGRAAESFPPGRPVRSFSEVPTP